MLPAPCAQHTYILLVQVRSEINQLGTKHGLELSKEHYSGHLVRRMPWTSNLESILSFTSVLLIFVHFGFPYATALGSDIKGVKLVNKFPVILD